MSQPDPARPPMDNSPALQTLYITIRFNNGPMKGLIYHDKRTGPDAAKLAKTWPIGRTIKPWAYGPSGYTVVDASFQQYVR